VATVLVVGLGCAIAGAMVAVWRCRTHGQRESALRVTVEQLRQSEFDLAHQARHDALTGLPNRILFAERLEVALERDSTLAIMILDLDDFKAVNDSLGHPAGDALLVAVSGRIATALRPGDTLARFGGDEFTVLVDVASEDEVPVIARRILSVLEQPVAIGGRTLFARGSLGIAVRAGGAAARRDGARRATELLRNADAAMYEAKRKGGQRFEFFSLDMHARVLDRLALECDLNDRALHDQLSVQYQPIIDLADGHIAGFEALARWDHPERGLIPPSAFVPVAEETGAIVAIGRWMLREACGQAQLWRRQFPALQSPTMNVNVSARHLAERDFVADVLRALDESGFDPASLTLEVAESILVADEHAVAETLVALKYAGVRIAVDDFGTGFSSLFHLQRLPIDELKVDRAFVAEIGMPDDSGVAAAAIRLGHSLGIDVVAEGIEREEQLAELRRFRCARGQGFFFGRPLDPADIEVLIARTDVQTLPPLPPKRVLVVDDEESIRLTVVRALQIDGFEAVEAATGSEAIAMAAQSPFDLVILDVNLPDIDGREVCRALRSGLTTPPPIVHISGAEVAVEDRVSGLDGGAQAYLIKPVAPAELIATLRAVLRSAESTAAAPR